MKLLSTLSQSFVLGCVLAACAPAAILFQTSKPIGAQSPTQLGRISRQGISQDWTLGEPFGGVINPTTTYSYETFTVQVGLQKYLQIEMNDTQGNLFVSAYQGSYQPDSSTTGNLGFDTNWLGDAGQSENYTFFDPTVIPNPDPRYFQVIARPFSKIVIVVSETTAGAGVGHPFHLTVEGFADTQYTDK